MTSRGVWRIRTTPAPDARVRSSGRAAQSSSSRTRGCVPTLSRTSPRWSPTKRGTRTLGQMRVTATVPGVRIALAQVARDARPSQRSPPVSRESSRPGLASPGVRVCPPTRSLPAHATCAPGPVGLLAADHPEDHVHQSICERPTPWAGHDQLSAQIPAPDAPIGLLRYGRGEVRLSGESGG